MTATTGRNEKIDSRVRRFERSVLWALIGLALSSITVGYVVLATSTAIVWKVVAVVAWAVMAISAGITLRARR